MANHDAAPKPHEPHRQALAALERELEASLERSQAHAGPVTLDQSAVGRVSRIDALQQQQMTAASRRSAEIRLQQVRSALRAIADGTFGTCRRCEEPVGAARLAARPESPFCLDCQQNRER